MAQKRNPTHTQNRIDAGQGNEKESKRDINSGEQKKNTFAKTIEIFEKTLNISTIQRLFCIRTKTAAATTTKVTMLDDNK